MNSIKDTKRTLGKYYTIYDRLPSHLILECDKCDKRWQLDCKKPIVGGSILHLLNHAYGHLQNKGDGQ